MRALLQKLNLEWIVLGYLGTSIFSALAGIFLRIEWLKNAGLTMFSIPFVCGFILVCYFQVTSRLRSKK